MYGISWFGGSDTGIQLVLTKKGKIINTGAVKWEELPGLIMDLTDEYGNLTPVEDTGELCIAEHIEATCRLEQIIA